MSALNGGSTPPPKIAMAVNGVDGRPALNMRIDRELLDLLTTHDRVTVVGDDMGIDRQVVDQEAQRFRYVTIDVV